MMPKERDEPEYPIGPAPAFAWAKNCGRPTPFFWVATRTTPALRVPVTRGWVDEMNMFRAPASISKVEVAEPATSIFRTAVTLLVSVFITLSR